VGSFPVVAASADDLSLLARVPGRPAEPHAREDAFEGKASPFAYRADVGLLAAEHAHENLVTRHQQAAEEANTRPGPAFEFRRDPPGEFLAGRDGQTGQQALRDLPSLPGLTCAHAPTVDSGARTSRRGKPASLADPAVPQLIFHASRYRKPGALPRF
jgi:hypothetical protein